MDKEPDIAWGLVLTTRVWAQILVEPAREESRPDRMQARRACHRILRGGPPRRVPGRRSTSASAPEDTAECLIPPSFGRRHLPRLCRRCGPPLAVCGRCCRIGGPPRCRRTTLVAHRWPTHRPERKACASAVSRGARARAWKPRHRSRHRCRCSRADRRCPGAHGRGGEGGTRARVRRQGAASAPMGARAARARRPPPATERPLARRHPRPLFCSVFPLRGAPSPSRGRPRDRRQRERQHDRRHDRMREYLPCSPPARPSARPCPRDRTSDNRQPPAMLLDRPPPGYKTLRRGLGDPPPDRRAGPTDSRWLRGAPPALHPPGRQQPGEPPTLLRRAPMTQEERRPLVASWALQRPPAEAAEAPQSPPGRPARPTNARATSPSAAVTG